MVFKTGTEYTGLNGTFMVDKQRDGRMNVWALYRVDGSIRRVERFYDRAHASMPQHEQAALEALAAAVQ